MKGLIIKDLMCLRKQRIIFTYLIVVTLVLSIMFVLSAKFGNIFAASQEMVEQDEMGGIAVDLIANEALIFFMLCPLAMVGELSATVFTLDGKAGFANVAASLPLSINKKILAKYIAAFSMLVIGVVADLFIAFVLSLLTDVVTFSEFFGIILSVASILLILSCLTIFFCFCFGYGKENYAEIISAFLMLFVFFGVNFEKLKQFFVATDGSDMNILKDMLNVLKNQYYIPFGIAMFVGILSYFGSVLVAKRKRGMI